MKNSTIFVLFFSLSTSLFGQIDKSDIYGHWKVVQVLQKPSDPQFEQLINGFEKATFSFGENGNFNLTTDSKSSLFLILTELTKNTLWKFEAKEQLIRIGGEEDGYTIMGIYPKHKNKTLEFYIAESGMTFEMKKVK